MGKTEKIKKELKKLEERKEDRIESHKKFLSDINAKIRVKEEELEKAYTEDLLSKFQVKNLKDFERVLESLDTLDVEEVSGKEEDDGNEYDR